MKHFSRILVLAALMAMFAGCGGGSSSSDPSGGGGTSGGGTAGGGSGGGNTSVCGDDLNTCSLDAVAYGAGVFVAVGTGGAESTAAGPGLWIETSTDGTHWTPRDPGLKQANDTLTSIAYGSQGFLATDGSSFIHSTGGSTWAVVNAGVSGNSGAATVGWDGVEYVVYDADSKPVRTSLDGVTFSDYGNITVTGGNAGIPYAITKVGSTYYSAWAATASAGILATSPDGLTWTQLSYAPTGANGQGLYVDALVHDNGVFVAVGGGYAFIAESPDGVSWSTVSPNVSDSSAAFNNLASNGSTFLAQGPELLYSSTDDVTWTSRSLVGVLKCNLSVCSPPAVQTNDVAAAPGGGFVIVAGNQAAYSTDAIHWVVSHI